MLPWLGERFGNPSGAHRVARAARQAVDEARDAVAEVLGCRPGEVVFTGGGTEADNLAVPGVHAARPGPLLCSAVEHHAVLGPVHRAGGRTVPVDRGRAGRPRRPRRRCSTPDTTLVSVMVANNEVGTVQPLAEVAERRAPARPDAAVHTDAVQAAAVARRRRRCGRRRPGRLSAHKFGGPQGVGALVVRAGTPLRPLVAGGGQERERRSGTHNVAGIVGLRRRAAGLGDPPARRPRRRSAPCATAWPTACSPSVPGAGRDRRRAATAACRARCTSRVAGRRERGAAVPARRGGRVRVGRVRLRQRRPAGRRTCWPPWASRPTGVPGRCGSRWAGRPPTPTSTGRSRSCPPPSPGCASG